MTDTGAHGTGELTPSSRFTLDYLGVPPGLAPYVTTFYHFRCDEPVFRDIQPAAVGHLTLFPHGNGTMTLPYGGGDPTSEVNLLTPFACAAPFHVDGPFHAIGAALSPLGWAALTGLCARTHGNRLYHAEKWLPPIIAARGRALCHAYRRGTMTAAECADELGQLILDHVRPLKPGHAAVIEATNRWLAADFNPAIEALYAASPLSPRQTQRLVERYFGLPPATLRRKYRALRAATLLSLPDLTPEYDAQIGAAFYDQPHMIREIKLFAGRTPARLSDTDAPFLSEMLTARNLRELPLSEAANDSQPS